MVVTEKQRDVLHRDALAPGDAAAEVDALLPFVFPQHHFTEMWRQLDVHPRKGAPEPERTDPRYCLYDKPFKRYVFTAAFVRRCAEEVGTREKWKAFFGMEPVLKVSSPGDRLADRAAEEASDRSA
jgi:hypothetical protein